MVDSAAVEIRRANIIDRLERNALIARESAKRGRRLSALDTQMFFNALADAGDFNRDHPEREIAPLDRHLCKVSEPRMTGSALVLQTDTNPADRWRTA